MSLAGSDHAYRWLRPPSSHRFHSHSHWVAVACLRNTRTGICRYFTLVSLSPLRVRKSSHIHAYRRSLLQPVRFHKEATCSPGKGLRGCSVEIPLQPSTPKASSLPSRASLHVIIGGEVLQALAQNMRKKHTKESKWTTVLPTRKYTSKLQHQKPRQ